MAVSSAYSVHHSYYLMYKAAELSILHAETDEERRKPYLLSAYAMIAFGVEAYVNEFCAVTIPDTLWSDVERKLSTVEKLKLAALVLCMQCVDTFRRHLRLCSDVLR